MTDLPIDPAVLAQLREELAPEDLAAVAAAYRTDAVAILAAMGTAAAAGDASAWRRGAHRLAGGASAIGARNVEATARSLMTAQDLTRDHAAVLASLEREVRASIEALRGLENGA